MHSWAKLNWKLTFLKRIALNFSKRLTLLKHTTLNFLKSNFVKAYCVEFFRNLTYLKRIVLNFTWDEMIQIGGGRLQYKPVSICYICDVHAALHRQTDMATCVHSFFVVLRAEHYSTLRGQRRRNLSGSTGVIVLFSTTTNIHIKVTPPIFLVYLKGTWVTG